MMSDRLDNVTQTISRLLEGYDIRLRPDFGGKYVFQAFFVLDSFMLFYPLTVNCNMHLKCKLC